MVCWVQDQTDYPTSNNKTVNGRDAVCNAFNQFLIDIGLAST